MIRSEPLHYLSDERAHSFYQTLFCIPESFFGSRLYDWLHFFITPFSTHPALSLTLRNIPNSTKILPEQPFYNIYHQLPHAFFQSAYSWPCILSYGVSESMWTSSKAEGYPSGIPKRKVSAPRKGGEYLSGVLETSRSLSHIYLLYCFPSSLLLVTLAKSLLDSRKKFSLPLWRAMGPSKWNNWTSCL